MTTKIRYDLVDDISRKNDVMSIAVSPTLRLAAGVWTMPVAVSISHTRLDCLSYAVGKLIANWPVWKLWLIAGHYAWQPDNRITRHNGFWKSLAKGGMVLPQGDFIDESVVESEGGLRVFGAVRFDFSQLKAVHAVMREAQAAVVFMTETQARSTVSLLVQRGWAMRNTKPPEEILEAVCTQSGLVVDAYGEFDDPDVAVAVIGQKEVLSGLKP